MGGSSNKGVSKKNTTKKGSLSEDVGASPEGGTSGLLTWFEIPAHDFSRAVSFYNHLFGIEMELSEVNGYSMALFPHDKGMNGAIICGEGSFPCDKGPLLYLNAADDLQQMIPRIEEFGGRLLLGQTQISETAGSFALFLDSEGNKLALHGK